ncbi:TPA: SIR2 family protein [Citrobacter farmeri]|uniref:SIR2 family protein n=1 Tax=Citrobacter farmeri TaxID=67824 RepID=UPI002298D862|nr:SIR2 family protein [Citrobacter farmeri]MEC3930845.1 SIR2 family protein [Citrobacter farmeri]HCW7016944.1 SIR2 family protein [Citrobacter farmeri]
MSVIEYYDHNDDKALNLLADCFKNNNLIPIIGSGFTVGCRTKKNKLVPSGEQFKGKMIEFISNKRNMGDDQVKKLESKKFSEISDLFFDDKWVDSDVRRQYLEESFDGAILDKNKKSFINDIRWPYIYTLNADDAIESCSQYITVLPYDSSLSAESKNHPTLYKIHGDIRYELRHDVSRLIFKKSDYLASINENKAMLELLQLDYKEKNIVYIGCSLYDELDLAFIVAKQSQQGRKQTKNIIFMTEKPDEIDEQDYINMGINCVILHEKGSYDQIYNCVNNAFQLAGENTPELQSLKIEIKSLSNNEKDNKDYLTTGLVQINNGQRISNHIIPYFYSNRDNEQQIKNALNDYSITILKGTRISGRTLLCYSILNTIKDRAVFIVDSTNKLNSHSLNRLLGQRNSVIFFDSQTLDYDLIHIIRKEKRHFRDKKISLLICAEINNSDEEHFLKGGDVSTIVFNIDNIPSQKEMGTINQRAIECHLPTFTAGRYFLDKIFNVYNILGENNALKKITITSELYIVLCVIATKYFITGQEVINSGLKISETKTLIQNYTPFLDIEEITTEERYDHTSFKIVSYASTWVIALLREFYRSKGKDWCIDNLITPLKKIYIKDKELAISIRKYDNLNFLFTEGRGGAADLIIGLYDKLQEIEGRDPEFYVQKGKAYYNIYQGNDQIDQIDLRIKELNTALSWARTSRSATTERNIIHIRALLWIKKMKMTDISDITEKNFSNSLSCIMEAINNMANVSYNDTLLNSESKSSINLKEYIHKIELNMGKIPFILNYKSDWESIKSKINI